MSGGPFSITAAVLSGMLVLTTIGACTARQGQRWAALPQHAALTGASFAADGFASIDVVPATLYPADPPAEPGKPESLVERFARENGITPAQAEAQINGDLSFRAESERLGTVLRREQSANFLGFRLVRDPAVAMVVSFAHDPARTLARYTRDPRFRAVGAPRTPAQMQALADLWLGRLQIAGVNAATGRNDLDGRLDIDVGVAAAEWDEIARGRGWTWGDEVRFTYAEPAATAFREPDLARSIRMVPRAASGATIVLTVAIHGRVVLDAGCFRLAGEHKPGDLVLFDRAATVGRDTQGYLAVFERGKLSSRIGEPAIWGGYPGADESSTEVRALRKLCGSGPIVSVGVPLSERLYALPFPEWVADYARAKKLSYRQGWDTIIACMKRGEARGKRGLALRDGCYTQFN